MDMGCRYTGIDLDQWDRGELFRTYINEMPIVMSLTVDLDVTGLVEFVRDHGLKFYPTMLWGSSSAGTMSHPPTPIFTERTSASPSW